MFYNHPAGLPELNDQSPLTKMRMKKRLSDKTDITKGHISSKAGEFDTQKTSLNNTTATPSIMTQN